MQKARFYFKVAHWFLTGIERGMYNDDSLIIDSDCFGDFFVTKLNEYIYLFEENPLGENAFSSFIPEVSLTYQQGSAVGATVLNQRVIMLNLPKDVPVKSFKIIYHPPGGAKKNLGGN